MVEICFFQEQFELIQGKIAKEKKISRYQGDSTSDTITAKRVELVKLLTKLEDKRKTKMDNEGCDLAADISETHTAVETWATVRAAFFKATMAKSSCAYCAKSYKTTIKASTGHTGIDISWPWGSEKPFSRNTWKTEDSFGSKKMNG